LTSDTTQTIAPTTSTGPPPSGPDAAPAETVTPSPAAPPLGPASEPVAPEPPATTTPEPPASAVVEAPRETTAPAIEPPAAGLPEPPAPGLLEPAAAYPPDRPETPAEAVLREAIKLMDDLAGVKAAMALLVAQGQAPAAAQLRSRSDSRPTSEDPIPAQAQEPAPLAGGAPSSGAAGAGPSGGSGSAALYALMIALAALAGGLWGRLELIPVRWRSVAIVALNERPG
jgi:hypothetical protein